jgi:hypothetical protein
MDCTETTVSAADINWHNVAERLANSAGTDERRQYWARKGLLAWLWVSLRFDDDIREQRGQAAPRSQPALMEYLRENGAEEGIVPGAFLLEDGSAPDGGYTKPDLLAKAGALVNAPGDPITIEEARWMVAYEHLLDVAYRTHNGRLLPRDITTAGSASRVMRLVRGDHLRDIVTNFLAEVPNLFHDALGDEIRANHRPGPSTVMLRANDLSVQRPAGGGLTGPQRDYLAYHQNRAIYHLSEITSQSITAQIAGLMKYRLRRYAHRFRCRNGTPEAPATASDRRARTRLEAAWNTAEMRIVDRAFDLALSDTGRSEP